MKSPWKDERGNVVIDDICPVCKRPVEMTGETFVLDTDTKPWKLYHKVCYRMAHPTQKRVK